MNVDQLRAAVSKGRRFKYLCFWGHTSRAGRVGKECLSQWHHSPFVIDDITYPTAEHYMMVEKSRLFGAVEQEQQILASSDPGKAKALGRQIPGFDESVWNRHRIPIVFRGNLAKFSQHSALGSFLVGTGQRILVEASPVDKIWGIGMDPRDPRCEEPSQWRGENLLGFTLMKVREKLLSAT